MPCCTVARLMQAMGPARAVRGKPVRTAVSNKATPCPLDRVNRQFRAPAPNRLSTSPVSRPDPGLSVERSRSAPSRTTSWHGGSAGPRMRASCSMTWNRPCTSCGQLSAEASSTKATAGPSVSRSARPSAWQRRPSSAGAAAIRWAGSAGRCSRPRVATRRRRRASLRGSRPSPSDLPRVRLSLGGSVWPAPNRTKRWHNPVRGNGA